MLVKRRMLSKCNVANELKEEKNIRDPQSDRYIFAINYYYRFLINFSREQTTTIFPFADCFYY